MPSVRNVRASILFGRSTFNPVRLFEENFNPQQVRDPSAGSCRRDPKHSKWDVYKSKKRWKHDFFIVFDYNGAIRQKNRKINEQMSPVSATSVTCLRDKAVYLHACSHVFV